MATKRRTLEVWEQDLLNEQKVLASIANTWRICVEVTETNLSEGGTYLDQRVAEVIASLTAQMKGALYYGSTVRDGKKKFDVPSLLYFIQEVNAEILAFQAGKPTAKGKPNGDNLTPPPPRGVSETPDR